MKLSAAPQAVVKAFQMCVKRFPVSTAFVTALSLFLVFSIIDEGKLLKGSCVGAVSYFLSVGFMLSLTLHLWQEEGQKRNTVLTVNTAAHLTLLADAIYIYNIQEDSDSYHYEVWVAHAAVILALFLSLFFLSFQKEKDNIASWNFTMRLMANSIICYMIGEVMWGGFSLLLASFNALFGIDLDFKWYAVIGVLTGLLLASWLFLGRIPSGEEKHDRTPVDSGFLNAVMRFLFLPLVGLYIVVLYIYAIQILVKWELPDGWVSWLVTASMLGLIIIEFGLYPVRKAQEKKSDNFIARYLPVIILPLLMLMTVGIVRRFSDYGITINRLYLITLNLWFYFVCITLFLTKARRINWITISFSLIFLLTSAFPANYFSITRYYMDSNIGKALAEKKLPINAKQYEQMLHSMPKEEAIQLNDRLRYLYEAYGREATETYVKDSVYVSFYHYDYFDGDVQSDPMEHYYISNDCENYAIDIPQGYKRMVRVFTPTVRVAKNRSFVKIAPEFETKVVDSVVVNLDTLRAHKDTMLTPIPIAGVSEKTLYLITRFSISSYQDPGTDIPEGYVVDITGFMFQK